MLCFVRWRGWKTKLLCHRQSLSQTLGANIKEALVSTNYTSEDGGTFKEAEDFNVKKDHMVEGNFPI